MPVQTNIPPERIGCLAPVLLPIVVLIAWLGMVVVDKIYDVAVEKSQPLERLPSGRLPDWILNEPPPPQSGVPTVNVPDRWEPRRPFAQSEGIRGRPSRQWGGSWNIRPEDAGYVTVWIRYDHGLTDDESWPESAIVSSSDLESVEFHELDAYVHTGGLDRELFVRVGDWDVKVEGVFRNVEDEMEVLLAVAERVVFDT